jgi:hypothetical protein
VDDNEFGTKVVTACNVGGSLAQAGPVGALGDVVAMWLPTIKELMINLGLDLAATSLPALKDLLEKWQPGVGLMKLVKRQLLKVLDQLMEALPKTPGLEDLVFGKA